MKTRNREQLLQNLFVIWCVEIYSNITKSKSRHTSTTESFKEKRMVKLTKAREQHGFRNMWTSDVTILVRIEGNYSSKIFYD